METVQATESSDIECLDLTDEVEFFPAITIKNSHESSLQLESFPKHDLSSANSKCEVNDLLRFKNSTGTNFKNFNLNNQRELHIKKRLNSEESSSKNMEQIFITGKQGYECYTLDDSSSDSENENGTMSLKSKSDSKPSKTKSPLKTQINQLNSKQSSFKGKNHIFITGEQEFYIVRDSESEYQTKPHRTYKQNNWTPASSSVISISSSDSEDENIIVPHCLDSKPSSTKSLFKAGIKSKTQINNSAVNSKKTNSEFVNDKSLFQVISSNSIVFDHNQYQGKESEFNLSSNSNTHTSTSMLQNKSHLEITSSSNSDSYKNELNQNKSPLDIGSVDNALKGVKRSTQSVSSLSISPQKKQKLNSFSNVSKSNVSANENTLVASTSTEENVELDKAWPTDYIPDDYDKLASLNSVDLVLNMEPFECLICFSNIAIGEGVILHDCLHSFCKQCLAAVIQHSETVLVKCPYNAEYVCESHLQEREVKSLVTNEIFDKYLQKSMTLAESQARDSFHCKTINCHGWCMYEDNVNFFLCPVCEKSNCLTCAAIHEGKNCQQYQDYVALSSDTDHEAKKTKQHLENLLKEQKAKKCPGCQIIIIKKGGCDVMKCSMCSKQFFWSGYDPWSKIVNTSQGAALNPLSLEAFFNFFQEQYSQPDQEVTTDPNHVYRWTPLPISKLKEKSEAEGVAHNLFLVREYETELVTQPVASTSTANDSSVWFSGYDANSQSFDQQSRENQVSPRTPQTRSLMLSSPSQQHMKSITQASKQHHNSNRMHIQCRNCNTIASFLSHSQVEILCGTCSAVLCKPTGGLLKPTENSLVLLE